jgi:hypothetical protein
MVEPDVLVGLERSVRVSIKPDEDVGFHRERCCCRAWSPDFAVVRMTGRLARGGATAGSGDPALQIRQRGCISVS